MFTSRNSQFRHFSNFDFQCRQTQNSRTIFFRHLSNWCVMHCLFRYCFRFCFEQIDRVVENFSILNVETISSFEKIDIYIKLNIWKKNCFLRWRINIKIIDIDECKTCRMSKRYAKENKSFVAFFMKIIKNVQKIFYIFFLISNEIKLNKSDDAKFARQAHNSNSSQTSFSNNIINISSI